jgi:ParB family transcriptional regulator, chromosome partitioning protein
MAKRRKLEAPSADDMNRIEEEFRRETPTRAAAPIAQVAADTADAYEAGTTEERAARARDSAEAQRFRDADAAGLIIFEIPLDAIEPLSMQRDRTVLDQEAMDELEHSISANGLRMPIEVYSLKSAPSGRQYGLLSGYRRLIAQQNLYARTGDARFKAIKAVLRDPNQMGGAFVAMVEENEIRQDLSHYERGRIAAIAAQQGAFASTEDAVAQMFAAASKAKRSKIRSFAMIFEELGDMLEFSENMREKDGLRLAAGLRAGAEARLRDVLGAGQGGDAKSEWALIEKVLSEYHGEAPDTNRGGRPKTMPPAPGWKGNDTLTTATGVTLKRELDDKGFLIRISGKGTSTDMIEAIMQDIREKLEKG